MRPDASCICNRTLTVPQTYTTHAWKPARLVGWQPAERTKGPETAAANYAINMALSSTASWCGRHAKRETIKQ